NVLFTATVSPMPFLLRFGALLVLMLASVAANGSALLFFWVPLTVLYRRLACETWNGLGRELVLSAWFALLIGTLALPTGGKPAVVLIEDAMLRLFIFVSSSQTFSRSLYPREGVWWLSRFLPGAATLTLEMALRFLPLLAHEIQDIVRIQRARGAFTDREWLVRLRALILPFFVRIFRMSERVEFALSARGIDPERPRCVVEPRLVRELVQTIEKEHACPR
ncbi:MAG TPA: energy-coupling factor transporter transmembrane component T, partial [Candidatus Ozemobacteraceae bacterium]|nr:energy-coupling factor transporter transmembrane component T [Candidatus Ozemobacteraceae bacterium]